MAAAITGSGTHTERRARRIDSDRGARSEPAIRAPSDIRARLSAPVHICRSALVTAPRIVSRTTGLSPPRRSRPPSVALLRLRPADGKRTLGESGSGTDGSPDYREGSTPGRPEAGRTREARDPVVLGGLPPPFLPAGSHSCEWAENSRGSYSQFPTVVKRTRSVIQELSGTSGKRNDLQGSG